jgi:hypothetical protein
VSSVLVERHSSASPTDEADLSRSSIPSLACGARRASRSAILASRSTSLASVASRSRQHPDIESGCADPVAHPWLFYPAAPVSLRYPAPLTDQPRLPVRALATMLLALGASFARSDPTLSRVREMHPGSPAIARTDCLTSALTKYDRRARI